MATPSTSKISTPKKVALAVLGALVLLTFVNLIEAAVNKYKANDLIVEQTQDYSFHVESKIVKEALPGIGELMIEREFDVAEGERLSINVGDADLIVSTHAAEQAHVKIYLDGSDMDRAREYFEDQRFEVMREDGTVYVVTHPVRKNYSWNRTGSPQITVEVAIPYIFDVDLKTSDGDVALERLEGEVNIRTSDGDITTGQVAGPVYVVRTSDGDIRSESIESDELSITTSDGDLVLDNIEAREALFRTSDGDIKMSHLTAGEAGISTSDGDLVIASFSGRELALRTSDGDIMVEELDANEAQANTSDGDITLKRVSGSISAKTSGGDLSVTIEKAGEETYLTTGDGSIRLSVPGDLGAELHLKGEDVRISSNFSFDGQLKEQEAEGRINGGGVQIVARTSGGEVIFREN